MSYETRQAVIDCKKAESTVHATRFRLSSVTRTEVVTFGNVLVGVTNILLFIASSLFIYFYMYLIRFGDTVDALKIEQATCFAFVDFLKFNVKEGYSILSVILIHIV